MVLLWSVVAALVLLVVGIFVALVVMGRIALFPTAQETVAPAPEETGIVDTSYSVMILNATPDDGLDDQMRDELINAGYNAELVFAVDGASDDFEDTTVYYVEDADADAAAGLADLIGGAIVEQSDYYAAMNDTGQAQLTIVIGLDRTGEAPAE